MNPDALIILEAAVLFEAGWEDMGDEVWVVVVDRETAIGRSISRDGFEREAVENRLDAQLSNAQRIEKAAIVIDNSSSTQAMEDVIHGNSEPGLRAEAIRGMRKSGSTRSMSASCSQLIHWRPLPMLPPSPQRASRARNGI